MGESESMTPVGEEHSGEARATFATVAPLPQIPAVEQLTYRIPPALAGRVLVGMRVVVPLGRRRVTALVLATADSPPEGIKCRDIEAVLDSEPVVPADLIELVRWIAEYYLAGVPEVLSLAVGRGLTTESRRIVELLDRTLAGSERERNLCAELERAAGPVDVRALERRMNAGSISRIVRSLAESGAVRVSDKLDEPRVKAHFERRVRLVRIPDEIRAAALFRRAPRRREIFETLLESPGRSATMSELGALFAAPAAPIAVLEREGIVEIAREESYRTPETGIEHGEPPVANPAQQAAIDAITASLDSFQAFLLHGVTASGKTEVYLRLIRTVLDAGGSALVLVPEISLTHQLLARLRGRFGNEVAVLHSELSAGERWDEWRRICRGEARIAVGARSAVLAPLIGLGLVIVDEEHDASYKQEDRVRYHGRDVAVVRARLAGCPVVLGSATPSLESYRNAREGRYELLELPERATTNPLPMMEVVDLCGRDLVALGGISEYLAERMQKNLTEGGQTLLFLNRRGFAASVQCYECGEIVECANCSVGMTLHQDRHELRCHHCDAVRPAPSRCPSCNKDSVVSLGLGTQRLEAAVARLLPGARIARLDRDTTGRKGHTGSVLNDWRHGRFDVLIGTQMIAKGHDVPGVTLVGVVHADMALSVADFRASERTFQLLSQVAGRAGRGEERGHVIVQTYQSDHPAIACAVRHDYQTFSAAELADRAELGYPPTARMAHLRFVSPDRIATERIATAAARMGEELLAAAGRAGVGGYEEGAVMLRGPAPAVVERVKGKYRYHLQLRGERGTAVRRLAAEIRDRLAPRARKADVRILVDVDPVDML